MAEIKKRKNPILALILSGLLPGLGQVYNNQIVKGIIFFAINIIISMMAYGPFMKFMKSFGSPEDLSGDMSLLYKLLIYSSAGTLVLIVAMIDAKRSADKLNSKNGMT
jgi:arabinogalactan oligomer / maltooligosaccharide transport system permease protein